MTSADDSEMSRRPFLNSVAAAPAVAAIGSQRVAGSSAGRIAVIGAGAFGGWTALHLQQAGADVTLIDAWGPANARASSGGETRIIRAIYGADRVYSEMVKRAFTLWDGLASARGEKFYVETGVLWMNRGSDSYVRSALPIVRELGFEVEQHTLDDAAKRYPQIRFDGVRSVWFEHKAGALSARLACHAARELFVKRGGTYRTASVQPGAVTNGKMSEIRLDYGSRLGFDACIFACGPWLSRLFPDVLKGWVKATRQEVLYFGPPAGSDRYAPPKMPIWIDFGERIVYGIPDTHGRGFKLADDTRGIEVDPTTQERTPSAEGIARARQLLSERFPELAHAPLVSSEVCQYENSPDGNLIIDRHPAAGNVWFVGGGSGHGFKLAPAVGEMAAAAIVSGGALPDNFHLGRMQAKAKPHTQFDPKQ